MAATVGTPARIAFPEGKTRAAVVTVTMDGTYAAGGEDITANACGLTRFDAIIPCGAAFGSATTGYAVMPVIASGGATAAIRLLSVNAPASTSTALTETSTANQASTTVTLLVIGV
jgi:hypothetical protein